MAKKKTPEYTRKAIEKYHLKFERMTISLPKGSKEWIANNTGKSANKFFNDLYNDYKKKYNND